jgi:histidinol-phosphate aminotransferase
MRDPLCPPNILALDPYQPGKPLSELQRELGGSWPEEGAVKLASNENPLGPSPAAVDAARAAIQDAHRYPEGSAFDLRRGLSAALKVPEAHLVLGAGSNEIIDLTVRAFCVPGADEVAAPAHAFVCYRLAAQTHGCRYRECPPRDDLQVDVDALLGVVTPQLKVLFLANPNNPTGAYLGRDGLGRLVRELPPRVILAIDEAYFEYGRAADYPDALALLSGRERMIVMRTFSKIHGLAGLRAGYAVAAAPIASTLQRVRLPFNVSSVAQAAALAALGDRAHVARSQALNRAELPMLSAEVERLGCRVFPSQGNFLLIELPRAGEMAGARVYEQLLRRGVIVRPLGPYGLTRHLRITVGTAAENQRLLSALRGVLP